MFHDAGVIKLQQARESTSTYKSNATAIIKKTKLLPLPTEKLEIDLSALIKKLEKLKTNLQ